MAKYTFELRELFEPIKFNPPLFTRNEIEEWFKDYNLNDYLTNKQIEVINNTGVWSKDKLAKMIVDHYYMREVGFETIGLFKHYVKITMQEIMEKYLPLIYSASIKYDPLVNVDFTETLTRNVEQSSTSNGSGIVISSDTPQTNINKTAIIAVIIPNILNKFANVTLSR